MRLPVCARQYQLATKVDDVYEVELPGQAKRLLSVFSTGVSFGVDELRTLISALRQNPPTLQFSHYNFLLIARVRVLNIVSGEGFKFTIDHISPISYIECVIYTISNILQICN